MVLIFFLLVGLIVVLCGIAFHLYIDNGRFSLLASRLKERCDTYRQSNECINARYFIERSGKGWNVVKMTEINGETILSVIKNFTDADSEFAYREAEELISVLKH